ncbi:hypothetical protein FB567DRAFT_274746 [Paraphoma chrysanthemicola]|uniref:F-box domain-containing protein n=1 Tax=Paraphoma chrysanthemicola TaxID=798071 RepID=A0A8K0RF75_9PLEO|nr:hypothetical protein FB567DRAFT_274746 [Paraphoma chrysanthemicola]
MEQLPTELLLLIATRLFNPQQNADLCNFSLASRRLRGAAQNILIQAPKLQCQLAENVCSSTSLLVRTMIERPDLGSKIRHLSWNISRSTYLSEHMPRLALNTAGLVGRYGIVSNACKQFAAQSELDLSTWIDAIESGKEGTYIGACLAFVPCLKSLEVTVSNKQSRATLPVMDDFFDQNINTILEHLPAFQNLDSFATNLTPPWKIVRLPTLRHVQIGLHSPSIMLKYLPAAEGPRPALRNLVISVPNSLLSHEAKKWFWFEAHQQYITALLRCTQNLEHLALRVVLRDKWVRPTKKLQWDVLLEYVPPLPRLASLEIDLTEEENPNRLVSCISRRGAQVARLRVAPCKSLEQFPVLRRLVVPQGVIIDSTEDAEGKSLTNTRFPSTLQEIGIIDSTHLLDQWAHNVLWNRDSFLALKQLDLWCDQNTEPIARTEAASPRRKKLNRPLPIASGGQVYSRAPTTKECRVEEATTSEQFDALRVDRVWEELRESGIEVMMHGREERFDWRRR